MGKGGASGSAMEPIKSESAVKVRVQGQAVKDRG